jgi:hypothetical protein
MYTTQLLLTIMKSMKKIQLFILQIFIKQCFKMAHI